MKANEQKNSENMARALNLVATITEVSGNSNIQSATFYPWEDFHPNGTVGKTLISENYLLVKCVVNNQGSYRSFTTDDIRMIVQDAAGTYVTIEWSLDTDGKALLFYNQNKTYTTSIAFPSRQETTFYISVHNPGLVTGQSLPSGTTWNSRVHLLFRDGHNFQDVNDIYLSMQQR